MDKHINLFLVSLGAALCCGIIPYSNSQVVADVVDQVFVVDSPTIKGVYNPGMGFSGTYYYPSPSFQDNPRITTAYLDFDSPFVFASGYAFWVSSFNLVNNDVSSITMSIVDISTLSHGDILSILDNYIFLDYCPSVFALYYYLDGSYSRGYLNGNLSIFDQAAYPSIEFETYGRSYVFIEYLPISVISEAYNFIAYDITLGFQPVLNDFSRTYEALRVSYENQMSSYGASEFARGRTQGYNEGRNSVSDESAAILTLFGAVANVPISVLNGMGQFVVWDVSIISILATFLVIAMFAWVIRKVI